MTQNADVRYHRFVMFADPKLGQASLSWRVKECLEAAGHTVLWFEPRLQPHAFARAGVVRAYMARAFLESQRPDCVVLADGLEPDYPADLAASAGSPVGALCEGAAAAAGCASRAASGGWSPDFAAVCGEGALEALSAGGFAGRAYALRPLPDAAFLARPLANSVAKKRGILCLQDYSPERFAPLRALKDEPGMANSPMRCVGKGWKDSWTADPSGTGMVYAIKSTHTVVAFDGKDAPSEHALGLALASGARGLSLGATAGGYWRKSLSACLGQEPFVEAGVAVMRDDVAGAAQGAYEGPLLDEDVEGLVASLRTDFGMPGCENPRIVVCVYGFLGRGNFANEHILETIDKRLRQRVPGSTVIAISMNPRHTLEYRGMYAVSIDDKHVLDKAIERSAVVLVVAGLLVDQGVRWGMGKAEVFSNLTGCDVYSISALAMLASLNEAKLVLYGVGAGPLELDDSRRLVRLMGALGSEFIARDEGVGALFEEIGIPEGQRMVKADPAFLGSCERTDYVDSWLADHGIDPESDRILAVTLRSGEGIAPDFPRRAAEAIDAALEADGKLRPVFCVMDSPDVDAIDVLRPYLDNVDELMVFRAWENLDAVGDLLARAYAGFSMQYYSTLAMMRAGVPCVGVSHQPKEAALFEQAGCKELSLTVEASAGEMAERLGAVLESRDEWAVRVGDGARRLIAHAEESEDYVVKAMREFGASKSFGIEGEFYLYDRSVIDRAHDREEAALAVRAEAAVSETDKMRRVQASRSYKLGKALTFIPRKLGL